MSANVVTHLENRTMIATFTGLCGADRVDEGGLVDLTKLVALRCLWSKSQEVDLDLTGWSGHRNTIQTLIYVWSIVKPKVRLCVA
jgi:hypothetical protein